MQWITTAPNPRTPTTGVDAGQRGWRLHCVDVAEDATFAAIKHTAALCGLQPRHGWGLDMFIEDRCRRCERALAKAMSGKP